MTARSPTIVEVGGVRFGERRVVIADISDAAAAPIGLRQARVRVLRCTGEATLSSLVACARKELMSTVVVPVSSAHDVERVARATDADIDVVLDATGSLNPAFIDVLGAQRFAVWVDDNAHTVARLAALGQTRILVRTTSAQSSSRWPIVVPADDGGAVAWADGVCVPCDRAREAARMASAVDVDRSFGERAQIDALDAVITAAIAERTQLGARLVVARQLRGGSRTDAAREADVVARCSAMLMESGLSPALAPEVSRRLCALLFEISKSPRHLDAS
jgi:chorismate mutase